MCNITKKKQQDWNDGHVVSLSISVLMTDVCTLRWMTECGYVMKRILNLIIRWFGFLVSQLYIRLWRCGSTTFISAVRISTYNS